MIPMGNPTPREGLANSKAKQLFSHIRRKRNGVYMRVKRETISEQCIKLLRDDIFERKLLPGTAVTEEALARDMGVSRATVREVLSTLTAEGLLTRNPTTR